MTNRLLKRCVAVIMAVVFIMTSVPVSAQNDTTSGNNDIYEIETAETDQQDNEQQPVILSEETCVKCKNTDSTTTFISGQDRYTTIFYSDPVRFTDGDTGELLDYDPSLTTLDEKDVTALEEVLDENASAEEDYLLVNDTGDTKQYFPEKLSGSSPIIMTRNDMTVSMYPDEEFEKVSTKKAEYTDGYEETNRKNLKAVYEVSDSSINYEYTSMNNGVKEDIVLYRRPVNNQFSYHIDCKDIYIRKNKEDEGFTLYDRYTNEPVGNILAPNMNDASGKAYSEDISTEIRTVGGRPGSYVITFTVDPAYLMSDNRHYPVTIDPTLTWKNDANLCDVCVCSGSAYKDTNYYGTSTTCVNMKSGKGTKGIHRTYIKFVDLTPSVKDRYVESAIFSMYETAYSGKGQTVQAYRVTGSWGKTTLKWSNRPGYTNLYDTVTSTATNKKLRKLDITEYCRGLAKGSFSNYGIMLKGADETGKYCEFHGSRYSTNTSLRPKLVITYYEKPATATSVSVSPTYIRPGGSYTLQWGGITAHALDYTQYRIAKYNASTGEDDADLISYSTSTKAGTTSSGSKALKAVSQMTDGKWHIYVRGVDKAGIKGTGKGTSLIVDGTAPASGTLTTVPSSTSAVPATSKTPTLNWTGFTDTNLKKIEYSINGEEYIQAGTTAAGTLTIAEDKMPVSGAYTISVRATDKAGNKTVKSIVYYLQIPFVIDGYLPVNGFGIRNDYGKNVLTWQTAGSLGTYCYYRVYRGTSTDFIPSAENLAGDKITGTHWTDINSAETGTVYKIELICNNAQGNLIRSEMVGAVTAPAQSYGESFSTATGTGHSYKAYEELSHPTCSMQADDVSGNLWLSQTDAGLPSAQIPFTVQRTYNSKAAYTGMFGHGWSDSIHMNLIKTEDGDMQFVDSDGTVYSFDQISTGYKCIENKKYELKASAAGEDVPIDTEVIEGVLNSGDMHSFQYDMGRTEEDGEEEPGESMSVRAKHCYTLKNDQGTLYRFDDGGRLISVVEPNDTYLLYIYDENGRICKVISNSLKAVDISYDQNGRAVRIDLPDESYLLYTYDNGELISVIHSSADGNESIGQTYVYDSNGRMISVPDGENNLYAITYEEGKLAEYTDPTGVQICFSYGDGETIIEKETSVGAGISAKTIEYDSNGRLTGFTDTSGRETRYTYGGSLLGQDRMYLVISETHEKGYETYNEGTHAISVHEGTVTCDTEYDNDQNVTSEEHEDGSETTYSYENGGTEWNKDLPASVNTENGNENIENVTYSYDACGNELSETDQTDSDNITKTITEYDQANCPSKTTEMIVEDPDDDEGIIVTSTDFEYDEDGNVTFEETTSSGTTTTETNEYDSMGRLLETTDSSTGTVTRYQYDVKGRQIRCSATTPSGNVTVSSSQYDDNGTLVSETDENGVVTAYTYDSLNRVTGRTVTKGTEQAVYHTSYGYESVLVHTLSGVRTVPCASYVQQSYGDNTVFSKEWYDGAGRLAAKEAAGVRTDYTYDRSDNQVAECTYSTSSPGNEKWAVTLYDENGCRFGSAVMPAVSGTGTAAVTESTIFTTQVTDEKGNIIEKTDAAGVKTGYAYDDSGRTVSVTENAGTATASVTTTAGYVNDDTENTQITTITGPLGHQSVEVTDQAGNTISISDADSDTGQHITTSYAYDQDGDLVRTNRQDGSYSEITYNDDKLESQVSFYDSENNERSRTTYIYDSKDRITETHDYSLSGGALNEYYAKYTGYDSAGRVAWVSETGAAATASEIDAHKIRYEYDAEDKLVYERYALASNGIQGIHYIYDEYRRIDEIYAVRATDDETLLRRYSYDSYGRVQAIEDHNADTSLQRDYVIERTYAYDDLDRVTEMEYRHDNTLLEGYQYSYDLCGRITSKRETRNTAVNGNDPCDKTTAYVYDELGQLIQSTVTDHLAQDQTAIKTYTYDAAGNRVGMTEGSAEKIYSYNGLNQLETVSEISGEEVSPIQEYTYDDNGNQILEQDLRTGISTRQAYDGADRLIKVAQESGDATAIIQQNTYNGEGQRISKTEGTQTTRYFYSNGMVSYTTGGDTAVKRIQYVNGLSENVIAAENEVSDPALYLYDKDIQSSTTSVIDSTGSVVSTYYYGDFGETAVQTTAELDNEVCYTGGIYDDSTGQYYLNARFYDPSTGRFMTEDTYRGELEEPDTLRLYLYCANDPINYVDPSGHKHRKNVITKRLTTLMRKNTGEFYKRIVNNIRRNGKINGLIKSIKYFLKNSKTKGKWDLKNSKSWTSQVKRDDFIIFRGKLLRYDDPGNIHFGFVGSMLFPIEVLKEGAGLYQIYSDLKPASIKNGIKHIGFENWLKDKKKKFKHIKTCYGDDPNDTRMIEYGHALFRNTSFMDIKNKFIKKYFK